MSATYNANYGITSAIRNNQIQNYIFQHANNNTTTYENGDLQPTHILPDKGPVNNITRKNYNDPTFENGIPDIYNPIDTYEGLTSKPLFYDEDDRLPDLITAGRASTKIAKTIGTATY